MPQLPNRFYALEHDGIHRITISDEYLGTQSDLLRAIAKRTPRRVMGVLPEGMSMEVSDQGMSIAKRVDELTMNTFYRPIVDVNEKVNLVPVWKPPGSEMSFIWKPPHNMKLYFVMFWECGEGNPERIEPQYYLIATSDNRRTYLLPLPNLYDDGRICLGRGVRFAGVPAVTQLENGLKLLRESNWNADLLRESMESRAHTLFRWDANGKQIMLNEGMDWVSLCTAISQSTYQFVSTL